jgi:hypothetical protein
VVLVGDGLVDSVFAVVMHRPHTWIDWLTEPALPSRLWLVTVLFFLMWIATERRER